MLRRLGLLGLGLLVFTQSCALGPDQGASRFTEEEFANLVIRHSSEHTVFRIKPLAMEGSFMKIYSQDTMAQDAANLSGRRDLAVVLLDYLYSPQDDREVIRLWSGDLREIGFRRVVFLRARGGDRVNGLPIVQDVHLAGYVLPRSATPACSVLALR